ncbi:hypothetical protein MKX03_005296, partial [Papaver bracteatum]
KRCVMGEFTTTVVIGPAHTKTTFLVIYINASFTMLLGRPWLHANLTVSSSLHQNLKFIYGDKLITIQGDLEEEEGKGKKNHIIIPAVETNMALSRENLPSLFEHGNTKVAHYLRKCRFFTGMGLGLRGNGCTGPVDGQQVSHEAPYGLGYHPTEEDRLKHELEKSPWNCQARKAA